MPIDELQLNVDIAAELDSLQSLAVFIKGEDQAEETIELPDSGPWHLQLKALADAGLDGPFTLKAGVDVEDVKATVDATIPSISNPANADILVAFEAPSTAALGAVIGQELPERAPLKLNGILAARPGKYSIDELDMVIGEGKITGKASYTYDTMVELSRIYKNKKLILLIGADSLLHLHTWYKAADIINNWTLLTYPRDHVSKGNKEVLEKLRKKWPENIASLLFESILPFGEFNISSTEIRKRLTDQKIITDFIDPLVKKYIKEKGLYQRD